MASAKVFVFVMLIVAAVFTSTISAAAFFSYGSSRNNRNRSPTSPPRQSRSRYDEIARVINPNPYANVGAGPFPAQPFWTYAGR